VAFLSGESGHAAIVPQADRRVVIARAGIAVTDTVQA
jgi:hypothetical protein